jgi:inosine-uridine nucleoside N-ribohydrolase
MRLHRTSQERLIRRTTIIVAVAVLVSWLLAPGIHAQEPPDQPGAPIPRVELPYFDGQNITAPQLRAAGARQQRPAGVPLPLLIDTDPGVDDAVALTWLLSQTRTPVQPLGIVTVAGNTSVLAATNNVLNVLVRLQKTVPVVMGAAAPLAQPASKTSWFIHGPDGLWLLGLQNPQNPAGVLTDATAFYCSTVAANPGATLLALGPLTNIANAVTACPATMQLLGNVVVLGGAKFGGNKTPVAEFNFWHDPEAANIVLAANLPLSIVPLDTFTMPTVQLRDVERLTNSRNPAASFLAPALQQYIAVQIQNTGRASIPDAVAAAYALDPTIGRSEPALVKIELAAGQTRGQTIVGLSVTERVAMIADDAELSLLAERAFAFPPDPEFDLDDELINILIRQPDNALLLTATSSRLLTKHILPDLRK